MGSCQLRRLTARSEYLYRGRPTDSSGPRISSVYAHAHKRRERLLLPRCDRRSVELRDQLDLADDAGVQRIEVTGGDPVLENGLTTHLVDLVAVQE